MKRYDFGSSKPHHHHGNQVMMGSNRHTAQCGYAVRWAGDQYRGDRL